MRDLSNDIVIQTNQNGLSYLQFKVLLNLGIEHAYILKCDKFNLKYADNLLIKNDDKKIYENICNSLNWDSTNIVRSVQKHTSNIKYIDKPYERFLLNNIDGMITDKKNITIVTTNADCILYLLYDKRKKVIANVHSGWRGSYQRIMEATVNKMINEFDCNSEDIIICICPSIRKCCFEVDQDVRDLFYERFSFIDNVNEYILNGYKENKYFIDTVGLNNVLLKNIGISNRNIYDCNICSVCNSDLIHSRRADGESFSLGTALIKL